MLYKTKKKEENKTELDRIQYRRNKKIGDNPIDERWTEHFTAYEAVTY